MSEHKWTPNSTKLMLQLYVERRSQFRDRSILKKSVWQDIANEMQDRGHKGVTDDVLDRKMRNMKKTYRSIKENKKNERNPVRWQYFEIMDNLFSDNDTIDVLSHIASLKTVEDVASEYTESTCQRSVNCLDENSTDMKEHSWTPNSTALMVELYAARKDKFRDPRILKKSLWLEICREMENAGYLNLTEEGLDRKMRNMKRTYRTIIENNREAGKPDSKTKWPYYATFETLFADEKIISKRGNTSTMQPEPIEEITLCDFIGESPENSTSGTLDEVLSETNEDYWTPIGTKLLLQLYVERKSRFRDPRIEKKYLWHEMRKEMENAGYENLSDEALELKIRSMKKTYRTIKKNKKKSGKRAGWPYYEIFNEILSDDKTTDIVSAIRSLKSEQNEEDVSFDFIDELSESSYDCLGNTSTSPSIKDDYDSMPNMPLTSQVEASQSEETYTHRKQQIKVEKSRIKAMKRLTRKIDECNKIQIERNELLKEFLNKFA